MKQKLPLIGLIVGVLLMGSPLYGFIGTVLGMTRAFDQLSSAGTHDPEQLSRPIGEVLVSTFIGVALFPVGFVIFVVALVFFIKQRSARTAAAVTPSLSIP